MISHVISIPLLLMRVMSVQCWTVSVLCVSFS